MRKGPYVTLLISTLAAGYPMCATAFAWAVDPWDFLYVGVQMGLFVAVLFVLIDLRLEAKWVSVVASIGALWFIVQFIHAAFVRSGAIELFVLGLPAATLASAAVLSIQLLRSAQGLPQNKPL